MNEDYLQHHGVKGMRWGVIRTTRERHGLKKQMRAANKEAKNKLYKLGGKNDNGLQRYKAEKKQNKLNYIKKAYDPKKVTLGRKLLEFQGGPLALAKGYKYATVADPKASKKRRLGYAYVFGSFAGDVIR